MIHKTKRLYSEIIAALLLLYIPIAYAQHPSGQSAAGARAGAQARESESSALVSHAAKYACANLGRLEENANQTRKKAFDNAYSLTLAWAAQRGNIAPIVVYVKIKGGDINRPQGPATLLEYAVRHPNLVIWLLEHGARVNRTYYAEDGSIALKCAVLREQNAQTTAILLKHNAPIGRFLLYESALLAPTDANLEIMRTLLSHGANPNELDHQSNGPLHCAIESLSDDKNSDKIDNVVKRVKMVIGWGADIKTCEKSFEKVEHKLHQKMITRAEYHNLTNVGRRNLDFYFPEQMKALKEMREFVKQYPEYHNNEIKALLIRLLCLDVKHSIMQYCADVSAPKKETYVPFASFLQTH